MLGLEICDDDLYVIEVVVNFDFEMSYWVVIVEWVLLWLLWVGCLVLVGCLVMLDEMGRFEFLVVVLFVDGWERIEVELFGDMNEVEVLGEYVVE